MQVLAGEQAAESIRDRRSVILLVVLIQMMILSEEEHLRDVFGEQYTSYCGRVPRYLGFPKKAA